MKINDLNQTKEVIDFLIGYAKNPKGYVILAGRNGTGKSYAALAVYNTVTPYVLPAYDHDTAIFITQADLNDLWINVDDKSHLLREVKNTKLLVLDDLGTRQPSDAFLDFLYAIFDHRYNLRREKGTIITTNLRYLTVKEKFGEAIASRISSGKCFKFEGKDRRLGEIL